MGQRGARIQAIVAELNGEKVDVVLWNEDPAQFVAEALSPAEVLNVRIDEEHKIANVVVPERQLSLAIGKEGQNARLAAKLTGWRIDIRLGCGVATQPRTRQHPRDAATPEEAPADAEARGLSTSRCGPARSAATSPQTVDDPPRARATARWRSTRPARPRAAARTVRPPPCHEPAASSGRPAGAGQRPRTDSRSPEVGNATA